MTTTSIDNTNIIATDDGTELAAAVKLEFLHAQADMVLKPNVADAETITGAWEFTTSINFSGVNTLTTIEGSTSATLLIAGDTGNSGDAGEADSRIIFTTDGAATTTPTFGYEFAMLNKAAGSEYLFSEYDSSVKTDVMKFLNGGIVELFVGSINNTFCMGDVTTPVGTYATALDTTAGETLLTTQQTLDHVVNMLVAMGAGKSV